MTNLQIDEEGYLIVQGFKVGRAMPDQTLQFLDKNDVRAQARGSRFATVSLQELVTVLVRYYGLRKVEQQ